MQWASLLNALGTQDFEQALKRVLSLLAASRGCAAFFHEVLSRPVVGCNGSCGREAMLDGCRFHEPSCKSSELWVHFEDGPWRAAIALAFPNRLDWADSLELSRCLAGTGEALAAILRKHMTTLPVEHARTEPLACLPTIEQCLVDCTDFPPREVEVCSRILYGLSSAGIAVDLDISETTIKTYRKRAYKRLAVRSERELIAWYLRAWAAWQCSCQ
jgi:DNA-binding CsgD family transcriptional regulator